MSNSSSNVIWGGGGGYNRKDISVSVIEGLYLGAYIRGDHVLDVTVVS